MGYPLSPMLGRQIHNLAAAAVQALLQAHALCILTRHRLSCRIYRHVQAVAFALHALLACYCTFELTIGLLPGQRAELRLGFMTEVTTATASARSDT